MKPRTLDALLLRGGVALLLGVLFTGCSDRSPVSAAPSVATRDAAPLPMPANAVTATLDSFPPSLPGYLLQISTTTPRIDAWGFYHSYGYFEPGRDALVSYGGLPSGFLRITFSKPVSRVRVIGNSPDGFEMKCPTRNGEILSGRMPGTWPDWLQTTAIDLSGPGIGACYFVGSTVIESITVVPETQEPKLVLTCDSTSLHRGSSVSCEAHAEPRTGGTLVVTGWSFEGEPRVDEPLDGTTWGGTMVRSGTITVKGKVGSGGEQAASISITVLPRDWSNKTPNITALRVPNGDQHTRPPLPANVQWTHDLGHVFYFPEQEQTAIVNAGPNRDYIYFAEVVFKAVGYYSLNDEAFAPNSLFQRAQEPNSSSSGSSTRIGGTNYCKQADVPRQEQRVERHELEHVRVYRERFAEHVRGEYARLEALVSKNDQELTDAADTITAAADREAAEQSRRVVDAPNGPLSVKFIDSQGQPCALKNVAGADLVNEPTR